MNLEISNSVFLLLCLSIWLVVPACTRDVISSADDIDGLAFDMPTLDAKLKQDLNAPDICQIPDVSKARLILVKWTYPCIVELREGDWINFNPAAFSSRPFAVVGIGVDKKTQSISGVVTASVIMLGTNEKIGEISSTFSLERRGIFFVAWPSIPYQAGNDKIPQIDGKQATLKMSFTYKGLTLSASRTVVLKFSPP